MKTVGIIGGIGPESTLVYYRCIVDTYRERKQDGSYPSIIINSIDMKKMLDLIAASELARVTEFLVRELDKLAKAGVDFGLLAAVTPHIVFEDICRQSPIPLLSIVEATCDAARAMGLKRAGLFGTRFTMQGRFFPDVFSREGIEMIVPQPDEQAWVHDKYLNELARGEVLKETRDRLLAIAHRMQVQEGIQGLILGGTELSLILGDAAERGIHFLDTARIHAQRAVELLLA